MRTREAIIALVSGLFAVGLSTTGAHSASCSGPISNVTAVGADRLVRPSANYSSDRRLTPLLATTIETGKAVTCIVVQLSAYVQPADNHAVFQVTLDGVPMQGHAASFPGTDVTIPMISEPVHNLPKWVTEMAPKRDPRPPGYPGRENYHDVPRTVGYTYFQAVKGPRKAKIELLVADCCSPVRGTGNTLVHAATLTVFH